MSAPNAFIAIETPVTDYLYDETLADARLRDLFLQFLKPARPPRKGENITVPAHEWESNLLGFALLHNIAVDGDSEVPAHIQIRNRIFGEPRAINAGGALANSFDTMVKATIGGKPLIDGVFVTAVGTGIAGDVFEASLRGKLVMPAPQGQQMEAHIPPIDGDRIIVAVPSFTNPPSNFMSAAQLDAINIDSNTKMVALGGYMFYTGKYDEFLQAVLQKVAAVSSDPAKRPTIVITAAAQDIAASPTLQNALLEAHRIAPVVVSANTGEFRRLMGMDAEWRKPHEAKWWINADGQSFASRPLSAFYDANTDEGIAFLKENGWVKLEGEDLERAKQADDAYMADKLDANDAAYKYAYERFCANTDLPVTFAVTNGKRGVHVVNGAGISENFLPPKPPHGVKNTVGGGDGFAAGYLLGHAMQLGIKECVQLGFVCAGEIIGRDEARLLPSDAVRELNGKEVNVSGLPAYLDPAKETHLNLLTQLRAAQKAKGKENEKKFLILHDGWKEAVRNMFPIKQNYVPDLADNDLRLTLRDDGQVVMLTATHPADGTLCHFAIPEEAIEKFGRENLVFITDETGTVPVSDKIAARIRVKQGHHLMTIKAGSDDEDDEGVYELEFKLQPDFAATLLPYCPDEIEKIRHEVPHAGKIWEVDVFKKRNTGLELAEIELTRHGEKFEKPSWVGVEVTGDPRFVNRVLAKKPYREWDIA